MLPESHERSPEYGPVPSGCDFGLAFAALDHVINCQLERLEQQWVSQRGRLEEPRQARTAGGSSPIQTTVRDRKETMNRFASNVLRLCAVSAIALSVLHPKPVWAGRIDVVAVSGQQAPDGNGVLSGFPDHRGVPALNNQGQVAFHAALSGTSGGNLDNSGMFRGGSGVTTQIAREGQTAPDGNGRYFGFDSPALNDAGQVAFFAALPPPVGRGR